MRTKALLWIPLVLLTVVGCSSTTASTSEAGVSGTGITLLVQLSTPDSAVAGGNVLVTVEALTADQNIATNFVGTVHLASSDRQATLPADYTFTTADGGIKEFDGSATLKSAGPQTITVEGTHGETSGTAHVTVLAAATTALRAESFPLGMAAGQQGNVVVTAYDVYGNVAQSYTGQVAVTSDSPNAVISAAYVYTSADRGTHAFGVTFTHTGLWTLTAQDANFTGHQSNIEVVPGDANYLVVTGLPSSAAAGTALSANVTVYDAYANVATNYLGGVHFNSNDLQATLPSDYTFQPGDRGVATFAQGFRFLTASGTQNLVASLNANVRANNQLAVTALAATHLSVVPSTNIVAGTPFAVTVRSVDIYNNIVPTWTGGVHFDGSDDSSNFPGDYNFLSADHGVHQFTGILTVYAAGAQTVTAGDVGNVLVTGTGHIAVAPAALSTLAFGGLSWVTANANFTTQLYALDNYGNAVTNFTSPIHVYSVDGNFAPQSFTMNQNVNGVLPLAGVHFGGAGFFTLSANTTINSVTITADVNFTVSAPLAFGLGQAANVVLGHAEMTASAPVCGGYNDHELWFPTGGLYTDNQSRIWLPDTQNHRVVGYNALPTANGTAPDFELGEIGLNTASANWPGAEPANPNSLTPGSVSGNGGDGLVVVDTVNNRVLIWNTAPTGTTDADALVGQSDFVNAVANCTSTTFNQPSDAMVVGGRLFVSDTDNHRVLIWSRVPSSTVGHAASWVLGQPDLGTCTAGTDANRLRYPHGLWSNGVLLAVADTSNNRVLLWNDVSQLAADGVAADVVIGQSSMTGATASTTATTMAQPYGVFGNGTSLFVADSGNHRVLIYPGVPTHNGAAATSVLGQVDLTHSAFANDQSHCGSNGAATAHSLWTPYGIGLSGTTLIVGSSGESRYLLYQSL